MKFNAGQRTPRLLLRSVLVVMMGISGLILATTLVMNSRDYGGSPPPKGVSYFEVFQSMSLQEILQREKIPPEEIAEVIFCAVPKNRMAGYEPLPAPLWKNGNDPQKVGFEFMTDATIITWDKDCAQRAAQHEMVSGFVAMRRHGTAFPTTPQKNIIFVKIEWKRPDSGLLSGLVGDGGGDGRPFPPVDKILAARTERAGDSRERQIWALVQNPAAWLKAATGKDQIDGNIWYLRDTGSPTDRRITAWHVHESAITIKSSWSAD